MVYLSVCDHGSVGRILILSQWKWVDGWPVNGRNGKSAGNNWFALKAQPEFRHFPITMNLPAKGELRFWPKLVWQWNHNPITVSLVGRERRIFRLEKLPVSTVYFKSHKYVGRNALLGPVCSGTTLLDVPKLKDGDFAGLVALQKFGEVGVNRGWQVEYVYMVSKQNR